MSKIIFSKIEERGKVYRVQTKLGNLSLSMVVLEESNNELRAYKTPMILEQNLKNQSDKLGIHLEEYFNKLITFLQNPSIVKFTFTKNSLAISAFLNSEHKGKYFFCDMNKVTEFSSFIGNLIDELYTFRRCSEEMQLELTEGYEQVKKDVTKYKNKLNELVERKKVDDEVMLANFVCLLNEKKRRIQHLTDTIEAFRENPSLANPVEVNQNYNWKRRKHNDPYQQPSAKVKEEVSESDVSNDGYNTTDSESNTKINELEVEETTVASQYIDDIFDESPPKIVAFPKISEKSSKNIDFSLSEPSTSKCDIKFNKNLNTEKKLPNESKSLDALSTNINTQDWLEGL